MRALKNVRAVLSDIFRIFETDVFIHDIEEIQASTREKLRSKLKNYVYAVLRQQPYFGKNIKKLLNYHPETWRYRIGDYRIFYTIDDQAKIVSILTLSARKDAY